MYVPIAVCMGAASRIVCAIFPAEFDPCKLPGGTASIGWLLVPWPPNYGVNEPGGPLGVLTSVRRVRL